MLIQPLRRPVTVARLKFRGLRSVVPNRHNIHELHLEAPREIRKVARHKRGFVGVLWTISREPSERAQVDGLDVQSLKSSHKICAMGAPPKQHSKKKTQKRNAGVLWNYALCVGREFPTAAEAVKVPGGVEALAGNRETQYL